VPRTNPVGVDDETRHELAALGYVEH